MKKTLVFLGAILIMNLAVSASSLLESGKPERTFVVGVRAGFNSSNVSNNFTTSVENMMWAHNEWKSGFTVGAVVDINLTNFFAIQPGAYLQKRRSDYKNLVLDEAGAEMQCIEGERHSNFFQIPILASLRLTLSKDVKGVVDFGPYFAFGFGGKDKGTITLVDTGVVGVRENPYKNDYFGEDGSYRSYDWGFKMGGGLLVQSKYYVGFHYDLGCRNAHRPIPLAKKEILGRNKAWNFTIGYNF